MNEPQLKLPKNPSEENLKKQAKRRARIDNIQLAEAQHRLAKQYGFASWPKLVAYVATVRRNSGDWYHDPGDNLPKAANSGDVTKVRELLAAGLFLQHDLDLALARVVCNMGTYTQVNRWIIADLLIDAGADPNGQYGGGYGRILFAACEGTDFEGIKYLIDRGAEVTDALPRLLGTYERGKNEARHKAIDILLSRGAAVPAEVTPAMLAIHRGDVKQLIDLIATDPMLPRRRFRDMPYGNMRLRGGTLLHQAVEFGELECIDALLDRWSEINLPADIVDGLGGQSPVFHAIATNQGRNLYTLEHLVKRLGYGIECNRLRGTFRAGDTIFDTPLSLSEYVEKVSSEDLPVWARASPREVELIRSVTWHSTKSKPESDKSPIERLQEACRAGDFDGVKQLVESGAVSKEKLQVGIEGCALAKREDIARYLIEHGADINADYIDNYGPVLLGFCEGLHDEEVEFVLKLGAKADWERRPESKYPHHSTPLRMVCETYVRGRNAAKHRVIDLLIAAGAQPHESEAVMAIHRGDAKKLGELIEADRSLVRKDQQIKAMFDFADEPRLGSGTLLHLAIEHNEIACADIILSNYRSWTDSDINTRAQEIDGVGGHTPLFLAARSWMGAGYPTLQWLIERVGQYIDASIIAKIREGDTIVEKTVLQYAGERERKLLEPFDRRTQIRSAIQANDLATFAAMLEAHPDLASPSLWGDVIHRAKSLEMTRMLLDRGVDPNVCPAPRKPLHLATYYSLADIIELLIERGADATFLNPLNERPIDLVDAYEPRPIGDEQSRRTREALIKAGAKDDIHTAVRSGDVEVVGRMLDADPSLINTPEPWNPLFTAARAGRIEVAKLLLNRGAAVDGTNDKGNTPLWFACQSPALASDRLMIAKLLLDAGADINKRCEDGTTALHFAAWRGPVEMVKLLLDHGARHWIADDKNLTPADHARNWADPGHKDAVVALLTGLQIDDVPFREAVAAIDSGNLDRLKQLLAEHPRLATDHLNSDSALTRGYFANPALLWFVAENPIRNRKLPPNIVAIAEAIIDAGATPDDVGYTLALVSSGLVPREMKQQVPLMELLVRRGADPSGALESALGEREQEAAEAALRLGAKHTLISAAAMGDSETVRQLLKENPSEKDKLRAFHLAATHGRIGPVDTLLDAGMDINARMPRVYEPTALHEAAWFNHRRLVDRMLQRGADPTITDTQFNGTAAGWAEHGGHKQLAQHIRDATPLVQAIAAMRRGDVEELQRLLQEHPKLITARLNGRTLLHVLCDWPANMPRSSDSARALVAVGMDVDVPLEQDTDHIAHAWAHNATPLHWAASSNDATELCQTLVDLGANIDATTSDDGTTPLTNAMHFNIRGATKVLLEAGAKTSVIIAAGLGDMAMLQSFFTPGGTLKPGAGTPPFKNATERQILSQAINFAAMRGHDNVIRYLADRGAPLSDIDTFVRHYTTPLHRTAIGNRVSTARLLLELGADPNVKDPQFNATPLGWAKHNGSADVAALLEEKA